MLIGIIILGLAITIVGFYFISKSKSNAKIEGDLLKFTTEQGWSELPLESNREFGFSGQSEGVNWILESIRPKSSHATGKTVTRWKTFLPQSKTAIFAGPKLPALIKKINLDGTLVKMMLDSALGDEAKNITGLNFLELKDHPLDSKYSIVSNEKESALRWIQPGQTILLNWKEKSSVPFIARFGKELLIQLDDSIKDPEILKSMVILGIELSKHQVDNF